MQPNHSHSYRRLARQAPLRSITSPAVLPALIVVALVTACSSGGGSPGAQVGAQVGGAPSGGGTPCGASGHEKIRVCGQLAPGSRPSFLQSCGH
jgi:hypothetical protein